MSPYVSEDYRKILRAFFSEKKARSGAKSEFAQFVGIQVSYLSQILKGTSHLKTEQALKACRYMNFDSSETEYFMLAVDFLRTDDSDLRAFYKEKLNHLKKKVTLDPKIEQFELSEETIKLLQGHYLHLLIYFILEKSGASSVDALSEITSENRIDILTSLNFMEKIGLVENKGSNFLVCKTFKQKVISQNKSLHESSRAKATRDYSTHSQNQSSLTFIGNGTKSTIEKVIRENLNALKASDEKTFILNIDLLSY